ncbi:MAG: hypothetical protein KC643_01595, partial [Nitrospira sp.]|nr:hypothetical protein [Nitrospira sp.]
PAPEARREAESSIPDEAHGVPLLYELLTQQPLALFFSIWIYLDLGRFRPMGVATALFDSGNSIFLTCICVNVVSKNPTAFKTLKTLSTVVDCATGFRKRYPTNTSISTVDSSLLIFDIHHPTFFTLC